MTAQGSFKVVKGKVTSIVQGNKSLFPGCRQRGHDSVNKFIIRNLIIPCLKLLLKDSVAVYICCDRFLAVIVRLIKVSFECALEAPIVD